MKLLGNILIIVGFIPLYIGFCAILSTSVAPNPELQNFAIVASFFGFYSLAVIGIGCVLRSFSKNKDCNNLLEPIIEHIAKISSLILIIVFGIAFFWLTLIFIGLTYRDIKIQARKGETTTKDGLRYRLQWFKKDLLLNVIIFIVSVICAPLIISPFL